jgi:NADH dehydrogenase [ubiquinone] 1 alpha subcomplex assembly factor 7
VDDETGPGAVRRRIVEAIRRDGPLPFDRFMDLALYSAGGYYDRPPVGAGGDFVTSPHVHPWFAYGLALAFGEMHEALGSPEPGRIVEVGAGDGTLAAQLLEILEDGGPLEYVAIERSAGARSALARRGISVRESIEDLERIDDALVVANELLDNLRFRRLRRRGGGVVEIRVGLDGERLVEVETSADGDPDLTEAVGRAPADRAEVFVPTGAAAFLDALAARMHHSYALLIDYSAERGSDVHGYRAHRVAEDVLDRPGSVDVTAGVDLDRVEELARAGGLRVLGRVSQRSALLALGFEDWVRASRDRTASAPSVHTRAWASRNRATLLIARDGLGAHRWLLLATPGLPAPRWLNDALERPSTD